MNQVNIRDARRRLSRLLDGAEHGKSVVITRHGRQVARLTPVEPAQRKRLPDLSEFRQTVRRKGTSLSRTVIQSRRQDRY
jgi:prevent-host-death family protein